MQKFGVLAGIDVVEEFNKLTQEDTVINYQENFEKMRSLLLIENPGLLKKYSISSFITGLNEELRPTVRRHKPLTLNHAFELVLWQKQVVEAMNRHKVG